MRLLVKVIPRASNDRVVGWLGDRLKVAVTAPPERGRANEAVVALLAGTLGLPSARVRVVSGHTSPLKTLEIDAPAASPLLSRLPSR